MNAGEPILLLKGATSPDGVQALRHFGSQSRPHDSNLLQSWLTCRGKPKVWVDGTHLYRWVLPSSTFLSCSVVTSWYPVQMKNINVPQLKLSSRISNVSASPTIALNAKAQALAATGKKILNFTVGEPDYPTPGLIVDKAIESLRAGKTKYSKAGGSPGLVEAVRLKLQKENHLEFSTSEIVCGIGAKEILFHIFLSVLNDGDEVLLTAPCWVSYADQIKAAGGIPVIIPFDGSGCAPGEKYKVDLKSVKKSWTKKTKVFVLNSPNNPAGYVFSKEQLQELGAFLQSEDCWILSDEIYEYMAFDAPHISLLNLFPDLKDRFIYVNGLSKSFAMTGWRVGYMAGPKEVANMVRNLQSHSSTCIPAFIEDAAVAALKAGKELMQNEIQDLKSRRDFVVQAFAEKIPFITPNGAFYLFLDVRQYLKVNQTTVNLCEQILEECSLAVVPGEAFGVPGFLRFSYTQPREILQAGISKLLQFFGQ